MDSETPVGPVPEATAPPALPPAPSAPPRLGPPPPPRRGRTLWIVLLVVVALVVMAALAIVMLIQAMGSLSLSGGPHRSAGPALQEVVVEDNGSRHKIALIDITGIISSTAWDRGGYNLVQMVRDALELAGEDDRVRAVLLTIDSPGGEVLASDEIARAIGEFQEEYGKVVVASMQGLAASGGYYTAVPCRWIVAHELTLTGSIGVLLQSYNYRGLMDKVGVRPQVFKSGRFKDMLRGDKLEHEITEEERAMAQALVDETFARFKQVVRDGREAAARANGDQGRPLADDWEAYADGRI
jgi:protease IV